MKTRERDRKVRGKISLCIKKEYYNMLKEGRVSQNY